MLDTAVLNNVVWCGIVCDTHGISQTSKENVWGLMSKAPAFYPDIVTSNKEVTEDEIIDFIGSREIFSIKDSYANLDLSPIGFKILFEAEWIYHKPIYNFNFFQSDWRVITTESDLAKWTKIQGTGNVIKPILLKREDVRIFMLEKKDGISGFIANIGAGAVGITNIFSSEHTIEDLWSTLPKVVSNEFPGLPLVGYEQDGNLTVAIQSGWASIGPLRVWIKSNQS